MSEKILEDNVGGYIVYPRSDKLGLSDTISPIAFFSMESQARTFTKKYWANTGEVEEGTVEQFRKSLELGKKVAYVRHITTDQGNGGAFCEHCNGILATNPFDIPEICPNCDYALIERTKDK